MSQRSYRSIGDVLTLLRAEFPDITISKIRFLESQGLVSPQRSPSGYRKFYDEDIERLRYVLLQQREHFLPLKVIRDRLNGADVQADAGSDETDDVDVEVAAEVETVTATVHIVEEVAAVSVATVPVAARPAPTPRPTVADVVAALQEAPPTPTPPPAPREPAVRAKGAAKVPEPMGDELTAEELAGATGLEVADVDLLVEFGILRPTKVAGLTCFQPTDAAVARAAARFLAAGVEPRHLRQFRNGVEREAGLLEQLAAPMLRQRNPEARRSAEDLMVQLADAGQDLRAALMEREVDRILGR